MDSTPKPGDRLTSPATIGSIVGVTIGVVAVVFVAGLVFYVVWYKKKMAQKEQQEQQMGESVNDFLKMGQSRPLCICFSLFLLRTKTANFLIRVNGPSNK